MKKCLLFFVAALISVMLQAQTNFKIENSELILPAPIVFEKGSDKIKAESEPSLKHIKEYLAAKTSITILRIEGHVSDSEGNVNKEDLSKKRAYAVCKWLVTNGVDCKRLLAVGFSNYKPIADNSTPEGKLKNTRIAVCNAALRNIPIGGMPLDGGGMLADDPCK